MKRGWFCLVVLGLITAVLTAAEPRDPEPSWTGKLTRDDARGVFGKQLGQASARDLDKEEPPPPTDKEGGFVKRKIGDEDVQLWSGPAPRFEPIKPKEGCPPVLIGVKLWAELSDEKGTRTGRLVNPETYLWRPADRLYLWFETTTPCHLAVLERQDVGVGLRPAKPGILRSPDRRFPLTYTVIPPGRAYRYPQLFALRDDPLPEFLTMLFLQAGQKLPDPDNPSNPGPSLPLDEGKNPSDMALKKHNDLLDSYGNKWLGGGGSVPAAAYVMGRFGPVNPIGVKPGEWTSKNPEAVCTYLIGSHPFGLKTVRIYKAVPVRGKD